MDKSEGVQGYNLFSYSANNPFNNSDPSGHWIIKDAIQWISKNIVRPAVKKAFDIRAEHKYTVVIGICGIVGFSPAGTLSTGIASDDKGNIGLIGSYGWGSSTPVLSVGGFGTFTPASDIESLQGTSDQLGLSIGAIGAEIMRFYDPKTNETVLGGTFLGSVGMVPFEMHSTTAESTVYMFNLRDFAEEVYIIIMEW